MINDVITGISRTLDTYFNNDSEQYAIYSENVEQGLQEHSFIISLVDTENTPFIGVRSKRTYNFDIVYISDNTTNKNLLAMGEQLLMALKWVTMIDGSIVMGLNMRYEIVDDVLHFFVTYPVTVIEKEDVNVMENYLINQTTTE